MQGNYLSPDEVVQQIEALTEIEYLRLANMRRPWALGLRGWGPDDLFHEALKRLIEGERQAPRNVSITVAVAQIMHSLAHERRVQQAKFMQETADGTVERTEPPQDTVEDLMNAEALVALEARVGNDNTARDVLRLRAEGYDPDEICARLSIKRTTYDSAVKRIRRAILKGEDRNE